MAANGYFKENSDGTIDCVCTELEATTVTATTIAGTATTGTDVIGQLHSSPETTYTADGAISLNDGIALLDGSSASTAMTLAAGAVGQHLSIVCIDSSNVTDVDLSTVGATATITFTAAGHAVHLVATSSGWAIVGNNGATLS